MSTTTGKRFFHLSITSPALGRLEEAENFFLAGNLNEALAAAQQAWREHPHDPDVFRVLAYVHMTRGEYPPAAQAAYQSVKIDGDNPASYATLAQVYVTFNLLGNAEETLQAGRQRFPDDVSLLVLAADLHFRMGKNEAAIALAREALFSNPDDAYVKALLGAYYVRKKWYAEAVPHLRDAARYYPSRWDYQRDLGIALLHTRLFQEARPALVQSIRRNPEDLSTKRHLFYAIKFTQPQQSQYWSVSFFFFNHTGLGWMLRIIGLVITIIGIVWLGITFNNAHFVGQSLFSSVFYTAMFLLLGGIALLVLTHSGLVMQNRKGRNFDLFLWKAVEGEIKNFPAE